MENFLFSLNATLPVFLIILFGAWLRYRGMFTEEFIRVADRFNFKVALPVLLFLDVATADIMTSFDWGFVLYCMGATVASFLLACLVAKVCLKEPTTAATFSMVSFRGSIAVLGVAFAVNIYGNAGVAPLMIAAVVPLYNVISVIILTISAGHAAKERVRIGKILREVVTNPLILAVLLAIPFAVWSIDIPTIPLKVLEYLKAIATPLALLVLGAGIRLGQTREKLLPVLGASAMKLVVLPAIFVTLAVVLGFRNAELVSIAIMLSSPTTVACYIMAKNMNNDAVLASGTVVVTTLGSSVTITLLVYILRSLGLI